MSVKDVKLYICDGCTKQILTPRNGIHLTLTEKAVWVGGFADHGVPAKGEVPAIKPKSPGKDTEPFKGLGTSTRAEYKDKQEVTLCRKCLAEKLGFAPDPDTPEEDDPKKPRPTDRYGHDDPL